MLKHIPNLLTISNLICGCIALYFTFNNNLVLAAYIIGLAAIFDFMDGAVARLLNVSGPIGKELDSLADLVSFGVVPGAVVFHLLEASTLSAYSFVALTIPAFSAYRLAKFNVDERQNENFIGLPTPANCLVFVSFPLITTFHGESMIASVIEIPEVLIALTLLSSLALVSELPLFSLKFKNLKYADNKLRFTFMGMAVLLLALIQFSAIPLIVLLYLILSIVFNLRDEN